MKWTPNKCKIVCLDHFTENDYVKYLVEIPGTRDDTPRLKKDDIGIMVYLTIYRKSDLTTEVSPSEKQQVW